GTNEGGTPILEKLRERAPPTLLVMSAAILAAYSIALGLGLLSAFRSRSGDDATILAATLVLFATPTACLAVWTAGRVGGAAALAALVLGAGMVASPLAQGRALVREVTRADYVRSARALG